ncbi:unnamed protein product [Bursaphelenchus xylophilus]|uniref:(pine wood nematode) hypothetical protein n=1 Tax=Bursaphelenchus xylophilus TaxID=6326 RepID=A0A1I7S5F1_BURXY|nr:unnamed protein product [Bursaphelenchus xylophilus]CAG9118005.1 unnamed protein product [Bursaphelenchus xylophilus]
MIARNLLGLTKRSAQIAAVRNVHKATEGTPPMRFISVPEKVATYLFIAFTFLSYPTYVMFRLDRLRPKPDNELSPETQAALEEHRAARLARSH